MPHQDRPNDLHTEAGRHQAVEEKPQADSKLLAASRRLLRCPTILCPANALAVAKARSIE
jgi:hypothetical protein